MTYRVLSLDGGGAWALIEVRALMELYAEETTGHQVLRDFDLVAANSGGSLVLGGLVENLPLRELLGYFEDETKRRTVFSPTRSRFARLLQQLEGVGPKFLKGIGPKYSADAKLKAIEQLLPRTGRTLMAKVANGIRGRSGADVHFLIVGFDYDSNRAKFFRSAPASRPGWGDGAATAVALSEAIHASTNAPVNYFDAPAQFPERPGRYWDGGVTGCNNPVMAAVTEAIVLRQKPTDLAVLSLGTGSVLSPAATRSAPAAGSDLQGFAKGFFGDLTKLASSILDDPPDSATFIAHVVTGGPHGVNPPAESRIARMCPVIGPVMENGEWVPPGGMTEDQLDYLSSVDMDAIDQAQVKAIADYAALWLADKVPNQAIRHNGGTLRAEVGYARFGEALKAWEAIRESEAS